MTRNLVTLSLLLVFAIIVELVAPYARAGRTAIPQASASPLTFLYFQGPSAAAIVKAKEMHSPAFLRARQIARDDLLAHGFRPTGSTLVVKARPKNPSLWMFIRGLMEPIVHADSFSTDSGVMVVETWDDGDPDTWEGWIYAEDSVSGDYSSADTQWYLDDTAQFGTAPLIIYVSGAYDSDHCRTRQICKVNNDRSPLAFVQELIEPLAFAQTTDGFPCTAAPTSLARAFMRQGMQRAIDNGGWILGSAAACAITSGGFTFVACGGLAVWGVMLDGYIGEFRRFHGRCG